MKDRKLIILSIFLIGMFLLLGQARTATFDNGLYTNSTTITKNQDIEFSLSRTFSKSFADETVATVDNVSTILDQIPDFKPNGTEFFKNRTYGLYYLSVVIENITVYDDKDPLDDGEIYLEVSSNNVNSVLDNAGSYYILGDGTSTTINILTYSDWANSTDIYISVRDSDFGLDDDLGTIWINGVYDYNWTQGFLTSTNDALVYISSTITGYTTIEIDEYAVASYYQPFIKLDINDKADSPTALFYRVYEGFDEEIGENATVIQYYYYWPYELDDFGNQFGHYYDFSPIYLYIREFGLVPYRMVYQGNNPGLTALPAELNIHSETYSSVLSGTGTYNVSEPLSPLLGERASFDLTLVPIQDFYDQGFYFFKSSFFPNIITPQVLVTDSYHNFETSYISFSYTDIGYSPSLTYFSDSLIYMFYELLEESFVSPLRDYSWNFYEVPENLTLTIDMLHNPFEFPYIIDTFENVTHQNRLARDNKITDFDGAIDLTLTLNIPATITLIHPATFMPGQNQEISLSIDMDGDNVALLFDYLIRLNSSLNMWFISESVEFDFEGQIEIKIPLDTISSMQRLTGTNEFSNSNAFLNYLSINSLFVDATLLGTLLNASVSIHLFEIVKDMITTFMPAALPILAVSDFFIEAIDLVFNPELTGLVIGEITTKNPSILTIQNNNFIFTEENIAQQFTLEIDSSFTGDSIDIQLNNLQYALNFTNSWDFVFKPGKFMKLFNVNDLTVPLGIFPNFQWTVAQPTGTISSNLLISSTILKADTSSSSETSSSQTSSSQSSSLTSSEFSSSISKDSESSASIVTSPGWLFSIILVALPVYLFIRSRNKS